MENKFLPFCHFTAVLWSSKLNYLFNKLSAFHVCLSCYWSLISSCGSMSWVVLQTTLTMLWQKSLSITGQMHEKLKSVWSLWKQIVKLSAFACWRIAQIINLCVGRLFATEISQWVHKNFCSYHKNDVSVLVHRWFSKNKSGKVYWVTNVQCSDLFCAIIFTK